MVNYKLFSVLRTLREEEFKDFGRWLESPIHNTNVQLVRLFAYLRRYLPKLSDADALTKERLYTHLYKDEFKEKRIRDLMSLLKKQAEDFIAWKQMEQQPNLYTKALVEGLEQREAYELFRQVIEQQEKAVGEEKRPALGVWHFTNQYELAHRLFFHPHTDKSADNTPLFQKMGNLLQTAVAISTLHLLCESRIRSRSVGDTASWGLASQIRQFIDDNRQAFHPIALFFADLLNLFDSPDLDDFIAHCGELEQLENQTHYFDYGMASKMLLNFANLQLRNGQTTYLPHLLKLHEQTLDAQLRHIGPQLSSVRFSNIVIHAVLNREFDWANRFIEKYQAYLPEGKEDPAVNFAHVYWHFHYAWSKGQAAHYSKAYEYVNKINYTNPMFDIRLRAIELRIGYECLGRETDNEWIKKRLLLFQRYLRQREDLPAHHKQDYTRFAQLFGQLVNARTSRSRLMRVYDAVRKDPPFALQQWLEDRAAQLLGLNA